VTFHNTISGTANLFSKKRAEVKQPIRAWQALFQRIWSLSQSAMPGTVPIGGWVHRPVKPCWIIRSSPRAEIGLENA
jgi:hypothetical protein